MADTENPVAVVDVSEINQATADRLVEAASTLGFVFIEGSAFTQKDVDEAFDLSKRFFELPVEQKNQVPIDESNYGYSAMNVENLDPDSHVKGDPKEAFNFGQFQNGELPHKVPDFFQQNIDQVQALQSKCHQLSIRLLKLLGMGLKIENDPDWFADRHRPDAKSESILRFLYYPGQKKTDPQEVIRAGAHTDYGTLTLLFQKKDQDGLEILSPVTKKWTPVPFLPAKDSQSCPPLIVNIADLLSFWTAGVLKSAIHRVKFPPRVQQTGQDRYSIVYFCHPENTTLLEPVPSPIVSAVKGRGANNSDLLTAKQHLDKRLAATYGWKY
ncbi:hypothetical protein TRICI_005531 [Trichomonascus ciferrii]|uniref:Fe2OG dioxygenase domain-containing protein n=1 Tax=Trichomonascus ciferrii TaxID=44093 RepID=A0A642US23_9ASCO|nr:hypothetical protein TRICI_005531 [Trichomonascus ciferrii]